MKEEYVGIGIVLVILLLLLGFGGYGMGGMMGMMWGFAPLMMISWIVLWVAVIYLAFQFFTKNTRKDSMEILAERYARGEITGEEYLKMKKELG